MSAPASPFGTAIATVLNTTTSAFTAVNTMCSAANKLASTADHLAGWADKTASMYEKEAEFALQLRHEELLARIEAHRAAAALLSPAAP